MEDEQLIQVLELATGLPQSFARWEKEVKMEMEVEGDLQIIIIIPLL